MAEYEMRQRTWTERDALIQSWNTNVDTESKGYNPDAHILGHNQFSDWTREEIDSLLLSTYTPRETSPKFLGLDSARSLEANSNDQEAPKDVPTEVNWVTSGAVNEPKSQGICRAAHTFAATATMEGAHFIKYGKLLKLSEQECVDCDNESYGCNGGYSENCLSYAYGNVGLMLESDYPWKGQAQSCGAVYSKKATAVEKINSIPPKSAQAIKENIAIGPVTMTIAAGSYIFIHYFGGIITSTECGTALTHEVSAVGYGVAKDSTTQEDIPYYLIKNSWGNKWGENGYVRIKMGGEDDWGICGTQEVSKRPDII